MSTIQDKIYADVAELHALRARDLTHDQIRAMLVIVRRLKTRLEVLDAERENKI